MYLEHNSRQNEFRKPQGATTCGSFVHFSLRCDQPDEIKQVKLVYQYGLREFAQSEQCLLWNGVDAYQLEVRLPIEYCLFFYWFEIERTTGETLIFGKNSEAADGSGKFLSSAPVVTAENQGENAWQITVYERSFNVPRWFQGAIVYQIFPDRFKRGTDYTWEKMHATTERYPERILHAEWNEDVDIYGHPSTGYLACDFFGGTLQGITESLDYLQSLGVDVLYLNPIFESRSNHRYDTGNYFQIDPLLGSKEQLDILISELHNRGMYLMLDGVFSHTGADSIYFNRYGRYSSLGAWQQATLNVPSAYSSWYRFHSASTPDVEPKALVSEANYDCWWGFADLPNVCEEDLSYQQYILSKTGVIPYWLRQGIDGWRLDVSDELPDTFLRALRKSVKGTNKNAVIMGEIWEDASNKVSYGHFRDFLFGSTHDSSMGYPFRQAVLGWLKNELTTIQAINQLETIWENYPQPTLFATLNLISSHDTARALTELSGIPDPGKRELQKEIKLSAEKRQEAETLLLLAVALQVACPGNISVYYGDEQGSEGYRDPFNRRTFNWEKASSDLTNKYRTLLQLRKKYPALTTGEYQALALDQDVIAIRRYSITNDADLLFIINRSSNGKIFRLENLQESFAKEPSDFVVVTNVQPITLAGKAALLIDLNSGIELYRE